MAGWLLAVGASFSTFWCFPVPWLILLGREIQSSKQSKASRHLRRLKCPTGEPLLTSLACFVSGHVTDRGMGALLSHSLPQGNNNKAFAIHWVNGFNGGGFGVILGPNAKVRETVNWWLALMLPLEAIGLFSLLTQFPVFSKRNCQHRGFRQMLKTPCDIHS